MSDGIDPKRLANAPREVEIEGKTYKVRDLDIDRQFQLAQWFFDRRVAAVERMPLDDAAKEAYRKALLKDYDAYQPGGDAFNVAALTPAGAAHGLYLALTDDYPELDEETVRRWVLQRIEAAITAAVQAAGDPKASSPGSSHPGGNACPTCGTSTSARSEKFSRSRRRK
jgi:hypothetical protein